MDIIRLEFSPQDSMIFSALGRLHDITQRGPDQSSPLDEESFNALADVLVVVIPAEKLGDFRFEYFGPKLQKLFGVDLTDTTFKGLLLQSLMWKPLKDFGRVARRGTSMMTEVRIKGPFAARYTRLLLPVRQEGSVRQIIGAYALDEAAPARVRSLGPR